MIRLSWFSHQYCEDPDILLSGWAMQVSMASMLKIGWLERSIQEPDQGGNTKPKPYFAFATNQDVAFSPSHFSRLRTSGEMFGDPTWLVGCIITLRQS